MKVLVLAEEFPYPLNSGSRIRRYQLWSRLASRCNITFVAYGQEKSESVSRLGEVGINVVAVENELPSQSGPLFYCRLLGNLFSGCPFNVSRHYTKAFALRVASQVSSFAPDILVCEWTPYGKYAQDVSVPITVISTENIESTIWRRYHEHEASILKRWYIGLQHRKMERFERDVIRKADGAIAVSRDEANQMQAWSPQTSVAVVENGVDTSYFIPYPPSTGTPRLVFSGAMDWRPNQHAAHYFATEIFPLIRERVPGISFAIVGRNPSPSIRCLTEMEGIEVTGTVDDIRPHLASASVIVVPLLIGGGSRLKILEALAMSLPVVSTSIGAEGLELKDEEHFLRADDKNTFAQQVCRLIQDQELRSKIGRSGRSLVERQYDWDQLATRQFEFLKSMCARP